MAKRKKRILFGAVDIGYRIKHYSDFIRTHFPDELEPESFSKYKLPESHYKTDYTYLCEIDKKSKLAVYWFTFRFFLKALFRYDVFHFLSGETILPWKLRAFELACYKLSGKKIIMHFVGSDIRCEDYLKEKNDHLAEYVAGNYRIKTPVSSELQKKLIAHARKYANCLIVSTPDLLQIIPEARYLPVFIDTSDLPVHQPQKQPEPIRILHAPSASNTKGSQYIHEALDELKNEFKGAIEIVVPGKTLRPGETYSLTRYELFSEFGKSHIVIDQLLIGWYGLKSVEALYLGCEVCCYIEPDTQRYLTQDNPIHPVNALNLKTELHHLILELIDRKDASHQRTQTLRNFVQKEHTIENYTDFFTNLWTH
jgi:hypothetical protein